MSLGNNILEARKRLQISQEKLGEKIGVTRQTISNWELGQTLPDAKQLVALSKALNISIDCLVDNDIQNMLEQKMSYVETEMSKNNKLMKISIIILLTLVITLILAFISLA
ncbi:MAG: helix-turn-helix transcriptional regulator [Coprobacillus cateniformis]|uniref:helix-turn-helix domain-containing protein n=1 Tax=Longibaculum muris TaxID=1796628 RepID=UPI003AB33890|nr:helix-turn-helix transcriptional regulator [Coprobacillus cateniformis]